ncbi:MAG: ATP-binding cassette domain-containing protein [Planctomycetes bacterium]|nr:ATP-binding cassette domain-containing protein [Planctomycetota bacterium]
MQGKRVMGESLLHEDAAPIEMDVQDLHKSFGQARVLAGVSLTVNRGEVIALIGGSGCGKTVLLKHLTGHHRAERGKVRMCNHDEEGSPLVDLATLSEDAMDRLRIHWAVVFQRNALLSGSVLFNLSFWPSEIKGLSPEQIQPIAVDALRAVGLDPNQLLERDRDELSGGMAKRLAIARALVMDPVVAFYDEPTAGLDPEMCATVHDLILKTHHTMPAAGVRRTSIVVTHDTGLLRRLAPRVIMLADGRVHFDGDFDSFIGRDDEHIRPYLEQMAVLHRRVPPDGPEEH